jgi:large subunit ribosomal protein L29
VDITELRDCTVERLGDLEQTLRRQIFEARIKNFTNQLDDTDSIRRARRDLARVKTILNERRDDVTVVTATTEAGEA